MSGTTVTTTTRRRRPSVTVIVTAVAIMMLVAHTPRLCRFAVFQYRPTWFSLGTGNRDGLNSRPRDIPITSSPLTRSPPAPSALLATT